MRLLNRQRNGVIRLGSWPHGAQLPPYAVLSHLRGDDEVSFEDLIAGTGKKKAGWKKLEFCASMAEDNGLRYFWIDGCCVDTRNDVELSEAINSMFRWYKTAARCYVYLSDVSSQLPGQLDFTWMSAFKSSQWFTRSWTLQDLLAPSYVSFFSWEGHLLGDKMSLGAVISEVTGIPSGAIQGKPLSKFSIKERMSWTKHRRAVLEEDEIYSLLGIFDVSMPPIYGEGRERAFLRLMGEIEEHSKC